jgi:hypothetical protein
MDGAKLIEHRAVSLDNRLILTAQAFFVSWGQTQ